MSESLNPTLKDAQAALQQQNWIRWQNLVEQALEQEHDFTVLRQLAGFAYQVQDWEYCARLLRRAAGVFPVEGELPLSFQELQDERLRVCYQAGFQDEALVILSQNLADLPVLPTDLNVPIELPQADRQRFVRYLSDRGMLYVQMNRHQEALEDWNFAARLEPENASLWVNIARLTERFRAQESQNIAKMAYIKALTLKPEMGAVWNSLGNVYLEHDELEHAAQAYQKAKEHGYDNAKLKLNTALLRWQEGHPGEALQRLNSLVQTEPEDARIHYNRAMLRMMHGEIAEGFAEHEAWRHQYQHPVLAIQRHKALPLWNGQALNHLLISCEQGFGDNIQFARYISILRERCERITLECYDELYALFQRLSAVLNDQRIQVIRIEDPLPSDLDAWCPMLRLPHLAGTTLESIPAPIPYFDVTGHDYHQAWVIGCVWAPGLSKELADIRRFKQRQVPPEHFVRLAERFPQAHFVKLQRQTPELPEGPPEIQALPAPIENFLDTARYLKGLDLLISVDTATAHLAGALNVPVWTLLPERSDWRWMLEREDTPWYPSMRLFRQRQRGDWAPSFVAIQNALQAALEYNHFRPC